MAGASEVKSDERATVKGNNEDDDPSVKCVLLDIGERFSKNGLAKLLMQRLISPIEGTICPISFVKETLVGHYAHNSLPLSIQNTPSLSSSE